MDEPASTALQQLADDRLDGRLRERVEELRRQGKRWRDISVTISAETRLGIARSTLHIWAQRGGWDVTPAGSDRATA